MTTTDRRRLGSRLQMARGWYWAFGVNGDPYAMLLCGQDDEPGHWYERIRTAGAGIFRSRCGAFVVTRYDAAARILDGPEFSRAAGETAPDWARPFLDLRTAAGPPPPAVEELVPHYRAALPGTGTRFDLMRDFAREVPVRAEAARLGADGADAEGIAALLRSAATAPDARLTPQTLAVTEQTVAALRALREQAGAAGPPAAAGCAMAANTVCNAVLATLRTPGLAGRLADDPDLADRIAAETLRTAPPAHLESRRATAAQIIQGTAIAAGDEVVVAVAAANRDPEVFAGPDRFDVDRAAAPPPLTSGLGCRDGLDEFAARHAAAALRALAGTLPGMTRTGPVVHRRRSPVVRGISRCPVEI
ncbi:MULTISPECIES: cytochrome P450 [Streptomyces]|uniref:Cytochrome P450 family protein EryCII n=1 Tax=Streptomyces griseofuscus TaxID=146922 RepID=A0A7H1QCV7_9ACTN|nr:MULTISPECIES: cytochrome P450 [Streptomyces]MBA9050685.1 desosaminyltransferase auxiliary protein/TDP-megosamine glycosyltransferase auxiliary protein [Streptomyces murinus]QNT98137.1 Cytochrome P450 family protein EryCII [Streptomyces griseofuscus]